MKKILVTDNVFVLPEHEQHLNASGFIVERLAKSTPGETELVHAIKGKVGYILGGNERVTRKVIDAADALQAIVFCGTGYKSFIPAWRYALQKGITIANIPDGHTHAVAEWAQAAALAMNRGLFAHDSITALGIEGQTVGIIGLGHIGRRLAEMLRTNRPRTVLYYDIHRQPAQETTLGVEFTAMADLLTKSDVIFLCVSGDVGKNFFDQNELGKMKSGALLVSFMVPGVINNTALFNELCAGRLRAISDYPMDKRFDDLPSMVWHSSKASRAFNNAAGIRYTSDQAVQALLDILTEKTRPKSATKPRPAFAILGSGISGLTVGNVLLERYPDARVTIYTDNDQNIVTNAASAQFYPIWLGDNLPRGHDTVLRKWFLASKKRFIEHSQLGMAINHVRNYELFTERTNPPPYFRDVLSNFEAAPDPTLPPPYNYRYTFDTMIINPLLYLPQITNRFISKGGVIVSKRINHLRDVLQLRESTIFNCLGMGAKDIFGDPLLQPVKGVSLRLLPIPGLRYAVSAGDVIIAPRGNEVYLGAPFLPEWKTLEPTLDEQKHILTSAKNIMEVPGSFFSLPKGTINQKNIIEVRSGIRPMRDTGPRVKKEHIGDKTIVHNYGHGGNGVILSWGTAEQAVELLGAGAKD